MSAYKKRAIPNAVRRDVCARAGATIGESTRAECAACSAPGLIEWPAQYAYWPIIHSLHLDHIIPERHGGEMVAENFQLLCPSCNKRKKDKMPERGPRNADQVN